MKRLFVWHATAVRNTNFLLTSVLVSGTNILKYQMIMKDHKEIESDIADTITLGRSWGMSEDEIKQCLLQYAANEEDESGGGKGKKRSSVAKKTSATTKEEPDSSALKWAWLIVKVMVLVPVFIVVLLGCVYNIIAIAAAISPEFEMYMGQVSSPYIYPAMRQARRLLKPLTDSLGFSLAGYYNADCMVENPYYLDPIDDCFLCENVQEIRDLTGHSVKRQKKFVEASDPFVLRNYMKNRVDIAALQKMYFAEEGRFEIGGFKEFLTNLDGVRNISDFFYKYNYEDILKARKGSGYMTWATNSVPTSQAIRKLFPRPDFIPPEGEVSLSKQIIIEGPIAALHEFSVAGFAKVWYVQAQGTRRVRLMAHPDCMEACSDLELVLNSGDLVFFQDQFWRLQTEPVMSDDPNAPAEKSVAIAFHGSFTS